jgi:DNA polymerase elongation subunit (family B)
MKPEQEFLHEMFYKDCLDTSFNNQPIRIQYIDIETEISDIFVRPKDATNRINMITIYDSLTEKFYTWSLEHSEIDFKEEPLCNYPKDKFVFFEFANNESRLLEHFLDWIENNYADVSYGWNTKFYDWPYIVRRIENVLGKNQAKRLSPVGKYSIKEIHQMGNNNIDPDIEVDIAGLFIADGLVLYRDKFLIAPALDGGYNLSNVGEHEKLGRKIEYEGTLKDLYVTDWRRFYEYNVRDVDLVVKLEDKCKLVNLVRKVTSRGLCPYWTIYTSISYLTGSLVAFSRDQMGTIFQSYLNKPNIKEEYEGAFVFPPVQGVYRGGIATIDFNSLYPSSIRASNMSIETYGRSVGLKYSDFGAFVGKMHETDSNGNTESGMQYEGFAGGYVNKEIKVANMTGKMDFSGRVIGTVQPKSEEGDNLRLDGNATLNFNNGTETLSLAFDNWYDVKIEKNGTQGDIHFTNGDVITNDEYKFAAGNELKTDNFINGNYEGKVVEDGVSHYGKIDINYYGNADKPTEATGVLQYVEHLQTGGGVRANMAFGGTRQ